MADEATPPRDPRNKASEPTDDQLPLKAYGGAKPPAPDWFNEAIATPYENHRVTVDGADIVYQAWGDRSRPGLLLVHGNGAHSHWWDFIAPFFAEDYRVIAPSFSGMGDSDWRETYSFDSFADELIAVAEHAGLFDHAEKPVMVAHSFGGMVGIVAATKAGERFRGGIIVDTHIEPPGDDRPGPPRRTRPNRIYPGLPALLERFRLAPPQPCDNHYAVDYIARHSVKETVDEHGTPGLTWKFDPFIFNKLSPSWDQRDELSFDTRCPIAFMRGAESILMTPRTTAYMQTLQDPPIPVVTVPEAHHHVMLDQPLAFVSAVRGMLLGWP